MKLLDPKALASQLHEVDGQRGFVNGDVHEWMVRYRVPQTRHAGVLGFQ